MTHPIPNKYLVRLALILCASIIITVNLLTFFEGVIHTEDNVLWHVALSMVETIILVLFALALPSRYYAIIFFLAVTIPDVLRLLLLWNHNHAMAGWHLTGYESRAELSMIFLCFVILSVVILQIIRQMNIYRQRVEYKRQLLTQLIDVLPVAISVDLRDGRRPVFNGAAQYSADKNDGIFAQQGQKSNFIQRLWQELDEQAASESVLGKLFHHNKVSKDAYQLYDVGYGLLDVPDRDPRAKEKQDHLFVYAIDISEREKLIHDLRQSQKEAQAASEAKTRFLANVSHELRTPITSIVGFAQYLSYLENVDDEVLESVHMIAESGEALLQLVNDILDLSKAESHKLVNNMTKVDVYSLIYDEIHMIHSNATAKGLELRTVFSFDLPEQVWIDGGKIKQILRNLLSNAFKFTKQGTISITVWSSDMVTWKHSQSASFNMQKLVDCLTIAQKYPPHHDDEVVLHVDIRDTGIGIAAEELEHIFDPFVQSQSGRESLGGTGLGLAISKQLSEFLGGEITMESAPHKGTRCHFYVRAKRTNVQRNVEDVSAYLEA